MSNVYKKLQQVRATLKTVPIKESGNNKFAGYQYMELGDFLPTIVDLCNDAGLCPVVSFADVATLTVVNVDEPNEQIVFTSPMSTADLKGCHAIQNLGAVETYLRRYLYVAAFDIVEHDALDSTHGKDTVKDKPKTGTSPPSGSTTMTECQATHFPRIQKALTTLHGDNLEAKKSTCLEHTIFTAKDGKVVRGVEDYRKLDGQRLEILCHKLEKLVEPPKSEGPPPELTIEDRIKLALTKLHGSDNKAKADMCEDLTGVRNFTELSDTDRETLCYLLERKVA